MRYDCIFCAYESYGVDGLTQHSATCNLHPLAAERDELRAEVERLNGQLQRGERCVGKLRELAHDLGWDGVNNSKILEVFLEQIITAATARAEAAEGRAAGLYRALCDTVKASGGIAREGLSDEFLILGVPAEMAARKKAQKAAESLVAGLRGALEKIAEMDWKCAATNAMGYRANKVAVAALALTPASAGARIKAEALREMAREIYLETDSEIARSIIELIDEKADRLTAEAEKEAANGR